MEARPVGLLLLWALVDAKSALSAFRGFRRGTCGLVTPVRGRHQAASPWGPGPEPIARTGRAFGSCTRNEGRLNCAGAADESGHERSA